MIQREKRLKPCLNNGYGLIKRGLDFCVGAGHVGGIDQAPVRFKGGAEVGWAGFVIGVVTHGNDDVRRVVGEAVGAFAVQPFGANAHAR